MSRGIQASATGPLDETREPIERMESTSHCTVSTALVASKASRTSVLEVARNTAGCEGISQEGIAHEGGVFVDMNGR